MAAKRPTPPAPDGLPEPAATRVALVEDDADLRRTMVAFINRAKGFLCAGAFADAHSALAGMTALQPDLVLMDIGLPDMSGIECVSILKERLPAVPFVMLTVYDEGEYLFESLKAGANGYLLKRAIGDKLIESMQQACAGGMPLTPHMAAMVGQYFREQRKTPRETIELSPREQEVLQLLAEGLRYKEIGAEMGISLDTVRDHARRIYHKLHVSSRTEAVVKFLGGGVKPSTAAGGL